MESVRTPSLPKSKSDTSRRRRPPPVWDSGSSLFDSIELKSFEKQLQSAMEAPMISRTFSMPHTFDRRPPPPPPDMKKNRRVNITGALQRLFRSVFRTKRHHCNKKDVTFEEGQGLCKEEINKDRLYYIFYDKSGALSSIPEGWEFDGPSEISRKLARRTTSARVPSLPASIGVY